jgi:hypothetical protein
MDGDLQERMKRMARTQPQFYLDSGKREEGADSSPAPGVNTLLL